VLFRSLSGLPGNILIEEKLRQELERRTDFAVLYFDLDNFKAYNDTYGFDNGDKVLSMLAQMIQQQVLLWGNRDCFVGHIGGDDFIAVVKQVNVEALCQALIELFDNRILDFYTERDKIKGYIIAKNRHGVEEKYPLISLSIAVVKNQAGRFKSTAALAETAGGVKKRCKVIWKSCYFVGPEACGH
jgi:diguanylate cyclase (GGDEF)-like protein